VGTWRRDGWIVLRRAVADAREDDLTTTAKALAYSLFLSIPAIFLVLLGLFSLFADESAIQELVAKARTVMPEEAATLLESSLRRSTEATRGGLLMTGLGLALGLWTTTSAATTLMTALTRTFDREDERGFVRKRLAALAIVLALAIGSALVFGLLVLGPHLEGWIGGAVGSPSLVAWAWWTAQWPLLALGLLFAFAVVLYLGPAVEQPRWQLVTPGAVTAVLLWLVASGGFAIYAASFGSYEKSWGTLSAVVVTLVWLWLTSGALLLGAEINAQAQRLAAERGDAEAVSPAARGSRAPTAPSLPRASGRGS
jgi:membrane protein